ncbi:hypothetical protein EH240_19950 [Mesorhizobium tamadayense]|uniref:Uncharacterized protein n=1 Tax=Mesorhizobium tamadayense TaxID=425306 RepID=A0A3P3FIY1_9HYPH|nr:hypothetical protein [Mesorhizobium tamadayense]RRH98072.1 hypothetical protein EH240_19950 [Mesorhizobium tamadayense]
MRDRKKVAKIALPLSTAPGDSGTTTVIFDGNGIPIGGTTGNNHPANAELLVHTFNFAWSDRTDGAMH